MTRNFVLILLLVILSSVLLGCKKRPDNILSDKEMIMLIADMEIAEIYLQNYNNGYYNDSIRDKTVKYILDKHQITKSDFDSTMTWYGKNIDVYQELYANVEKELLKRENKVTGIAKEELITNDLWPYSRHYIIDPKSGRRDISFSIPANDIKPGERIIWRLRTNLSYSGNMMLCAEYENGVTSILNQSTNIKVPEINFQTDSGFRIKRILGQFRIKDSMTVPIWVDSVSLKTLPFDSVEYHKIYSQRSYRGPNRRLTATEKNDTIADADNSNSMAKLTINDKASKAAPAQKVEIKHTEISNENDFRPLKPGDKPKKNLKASKKIGVTN